ncbi:hypothetical protein ACFL15_00095 [Patescibacteria group bacterium]
MTTKVLLKVFVGLLLLSMSSSLLIKDVHAVQYGRPDGDITTTNWTTTPLWSKIEETPYSDTDYISATANLISTAEVSLGNVTDPVSGSGHTVRFRARVNKTSKAGQMYVYLLQGGTTITSQVYDETIGTSFTPLTITLSSAAADSITDYSDLRIRFYQTDITTGGNAYHVSWAELEVPDAPVPEVAISLTTDGSVPFGGMSLNDTRDTTSGDLNDIQTVSVDAGPADLDIKSDNYTGAGTLTLSSAAGSNLVLFEYSDDGSSWSTFVTNDTYYSLATSVSQGGTQDVYYRLTTPTTIGAFGDYGTTTTILASEP